MGSAYVIYLTNYTQHANDINSDEISFITLQILITITENT